MSPVQSVTDCFGTLRCHFMDNKMFNDDPTYTVPNSRFTHRTLQLHRLSRNFSIWADYELYGSYSPP
jgi:hypothetical protein